MAEVYLAERLSPDGIKSETFAIKRLLPALAKNPIFADMFAGEASLSKSFDHPNIVRSHEFFREGDDYYLVLEYVLGKEVGTVTHVAKSWLPLERVKLAVAVGLGVASALSYVHNKTDVRKTPLGIVHGDISPQNIMITTEGEIKIYDFGAAKTNIASLVFDDKLVRGNWRYMSPEQKAGQTIAAASDVYSLSLIMFEIIFGDVIALRENVDRDEWLKASFLAMGLSEDAQAALYRAFQSGLSVNGEERISCEELSELLFGLARELRIYDVNQFLAQILRTDVPQLARRVRRRASVGFGYLWYFSAAAASLGLSIWFMIAIFTDLFEPRHLHNLPVWPTASLPQEKAETKLALRDIPVGEPVQKAARADKHGTLLVKVKPWAEVYIDGQFFGSTPMGGLNLPVGHYLVQLRNPDVSAVALKMVKIYADKKTELVHHF